MPAQPTLRTARLLLRPATVGDLGYLHTLWNAPEVRRYLFDDEEVTPQLAEAVLAECLGRAAEGLGLWIALAGAEPVGCVGLNPTTAVAELAPDLAGELEPLAALDPAHWGRGFAVEALAALIAHAFGPLARPRLLAVHDRPNTASERLVLRLGFQPARDLEGPRYPMRAYWLER
jgi:[ribosomal protein S5]-alanine N-acetyltransferase